MSTIKPKPSLICEVCGRPFISWRPGLKMRFCSKACYGISRRKRPRVKVCPVCGDTFRTKDGRQKYCSLKCVGVTRRTGGAQGTCARCGEPYPLRSGKKYCSVTCYQLSRCKSAEARRRYLKRLAEREKAGIRASEMADIDPIEEEGEDFQTEASLRVQDRLDRLCEKVMGLLWGADMPRNFDGTIDERRAVLRRRLSKEKYAHLERLWARVDVVSKKPRETESQFGFAEGERGDYGRRDMDGTREPATSISVAQGQG